MSFTTEPSDGEWAWIGDGRVPQDPFDGEWTAIGRGPLMDWVGEAKIGGDESSAAAGPLVGWVGDTKIIGEESAAGEEAGTWVAEPAAAKEASCGPIGGGVLSGIENEVWTAGDKATVVIRGRRRVHRGAGVEDAAGAVDAGSEDEGGRLAAGGGIAEGADDPAENLATRTLYPALFVRWALMAARELPGK